MTKRARSSSTIEASVTIRFACEPEPLKTDRIVDGPTDGRADRMRTIENVPLGVISGGRVATEDCRLTVFAGRPGVGQGSARPQRAAVPRHFGEAWRCSPFTSLPAPARWRSTSPCTRSAPRSRRGRSPSPGSSIARPLTEVAAILFYLARTFPEAGLLPQGDMEAEARVISWMSFIAATIHPARRQGRVHADAVWRIAERRLGAQGWAIGRYSIADIHLFRVYWRFMNSLHPAPETFPNLSAHHDRMMARPAVSRPCEIERAIGYELPQ